MILCCGEALIDMVPSTSVDGDPCFVPKAGGAVFNTAIALGRLGADVGLFTGVSNDLFGRILHDELTESNVQTRHLVARDVPSSLAFVELTNGQAQYTFYTDNAADTSLTNAEVPADLDDVKALFFGGISLCTDPTSTTMQAFMAAQSANRVTMIDPNIRPSFISDEVTYRARLHDMIGHSDILKISDEDLNWLVPELDSIEAQLAAIVDESKLVFVTKGADGADAYIGTNRVAYADAKSVKIADTIGAGDTFNAAILHVLKARGSFSAPPHFNPSIAAIQAALDLAIATAAITVSRVGANPPWAAETE